MRWSRGRGTSAARRCRNSGEVITRLGGPIAIRGFELEGDLAGRGAAQAFVAKGRVGDVAPEVCEWVG